MSQSLNSYEQKPLNICLHALCKMIHDIFSPDRNQNKMYFKIF